MGYDRYIIGRVIRRERRRKGLTQEVLSGLAGMARSHLAEIESGATVPNVETLWRIADALDMKLSRLIALAEEELPE